MSLLTVLNSSPICNTRLNMCLCRDFINAKVFILCIIVPCISFFNEYVSAPWPTAFCFLYLTCKHSVSMNASKLFHLSHQLYPHSYPFLFPPHKEEKKKKEKKNRGSLTSPDPGLHKKLLTPTSFPTVSFFSLQGIWPPFCYLYLLTTEHNSNSNKLLSTNFALFSSLISTFAYLTRRRGGEK